MTHQRGTVLFYALSLSLLIASCGRSETADQTPPAVSPPPSEPRPEPEGPPKLTASALSVGGSPFLVRGGAETPLSAGDALHEGDAVRTDGASWAEIAIGDSAVIRVLPGSRSTLLSLAAASDDLPWPSVEIGVESGGVLSKVSKLSGREEFLVVTENSAASVRGTAFWVGVDAPNGSDSSVRSRIAVSAGSVAVLPKGPLFSSLLDGRRANPVAGAVVRTAFAFAPKVGPRSELAVSPTPESTNDAESLYGELLIAAEKANSSGLNLDTADDPTPYLAPAGGAVSEGLRRVSRRYVPAALSPSGAAALRFLEDMRNPSAGYEARPVAMPPERPESGSGPSAPKTSPSVLWTSIVTRARFSDSLTRTGELVVAFDSTGRVYAVDSGGAVSWTVDADARAVTAVGDRLAVVSSRDFSLLDGATGELRGSVALDFSAGAGSAKPVAVPEGIAVVVPSGIAVLRAENASMLREIPVDGGVASPPVLAERELVCVTGKGSLAFLDTSGAGSGAVVQIALAGQPFAPRYKAGRIVVGDRSGRIVAVSVQDRTVLWSRDLGVPLGSEAEVGDSRVFAWTTDKRIHTLSLSDGSDAAAPTPGASSPPLLSGGRLYWGSSAGELVVADGRSGAVVKRIPVAREIGVRPLMVGGRIYAGTSDGRVVKIDVDR